jgi:hypothetical protein
LRQERDTLLAKLASLQYSFETDTSEISLVHIPGAPKDIMDQVERILHPQKLSMLPKLRPTKKYAHGTQTDSMDYYNVKKEADYASIEQEKEKFRQAYNLEKEINKELHLTLEEVQKDADRLETQYNRLSNDAEVALASERLTLKKHDEHVAIIQSQQSKISIIQADLDSLLMKYQKLERDHELLEKQIKVTEEIRVASRPMVDPLIYLETQWSKDRNKLLTETEQWKNAVQHLKLQNELLKDDLERNLANGPEPAEYAQLVGDYSVAKDQLKKLAEQVRIQTSSICNLESQLLKTESNLSTRMTQLKNAQFQLGQLKKDTLKKENLIKDQGLQIEKLNKTIKELQGKAKLEL